MRLYRHLALFVAENFQHMHIEKTVHNAAPLAHYTDGDLVRHRTATDGDPRPQEHLLVARWMVPASTPAERARSPMNGRKRKLPPEALLGVMSIVRTHMDPGWAKLAAAIGIDPKLGRG